MQETEAKASPESKSDEKRTPLSYVGTFEDSQLSFALEEPANDES
jgi:hypothetical protein